MDLAEKEEQLACLTLPTIDEVIKTHTMLVYDLKEKNKYHTADALGITVKTLYNWFHRWGVIEPAPKRYKYK